MLTPQGMSSLLTAILGGSVGFLLGALARALGIPSDVRTHDAAIADRDGQLDTWTADRDYELRRECPKLRARLPAGVGNENVPYHLMATEVDRQITDAKAKALHAWRDEARHAHLDVATILAAEGWPHRVYRRLTHNATPTLTTPDRAAGVLDAWRKPSSMAVDRLTYPDDATKRTLEAAIATMPASGP